MGNNSTSGHKPLQRFVNEPEDVSHEALEGYLMTTDAPVALLDTFPESKVLVRTDWSKDRVAVVACGGTGHGLYDLEYVGEGMLTAIAAGCVWKEPTVREVEEAILSVIGAPGCILVMKNAVGDFLTANIARHELKRQFGSELSKRVRFVTVSDDVVAFGNASQSGHSVDSGKVTNFGRGIAGCVLVLKVAGAAAAAGLPLDQVYEEAASCAAETRSIGVAYSRGTAYIEAWTSSVPNHDHSDEGMEIGVGVTGEPGWMRSSKALPAKDVVDLMVARLMPTLPSAGPLCVMLNNLGTVPHIEMSILAKQVMESGIGNRVELLLGPAVYFSALNTNGFSLSVVPLSGRRREWLVAETGCPGWVRPTEPKRHLRCVPAPELTTSNSASSKPSKHPEVHRLLSEVCEALIQAEDEIGRLSAKTGTGKLGHTLAKFAQDLKAKLDDSRLPLASPKRLFEALSAQCANYRGVMFTCAKVLFETAADNLPEHEQDGDTSLWDLWPVVEALRAGVNEVSEQLGVGLNRRTFLDSLVPALETQEASLELEAHELNRPYCEWWRAAAASSARRGARQTAHMLHASDWAAYTPLAQRGGVPDGGAVAVATILTAIATPPEMRFRLLLLNEIEMFFNSEPALEPERKLERCPSNSDQSRDRVSSQGTDKGNSTIRAVPSLRMLSALPDHTEETEKEAEQRRVWDELAATYALEGKIVGSGFGQVRRGKCISGPFQGHAVAISERKVSSLRELGMQGFRDSLVMNSLQMLNWLCTPKPNIVKVLEVVFSPRSDFIVMEFLPGLSLMDVLKQGKLELHRVWQLTGEIVSAVRRLHQTRLIHRDLKPEHFRFSVAPDQGELQLVDVSGMIIHLSESYEAEFGKTVACGSLAYMSPEALLGCGRQAADMWSIGVMLHLMLIGELPFGLIHVKNDKEAQEAHHSPLTTLAETPLPKEAREMVEKLLDLNARKRMTAKEAWDFLQQSHWCWDDGNPQGRENWASKCEEPLSISQMSAVDWGTSPRTTASLRPEKMGIDRGGSFLTALTPKNGTSAGHDRIITKTLYLIRHGEALHNIEEKKAIREAAATAISKLKLEPGSVEFRDYLEKARTRVLSSPDFFNAPLSDKGLKEAIRAKSHIAALHHRGLPAPTMVLTSPLLRTLQTTAGIFPFHSNVHAREDLRERQTGHPCDTYSCNELQDTRSSFQTMDFHDVQDGKPPACEGSTAIEDKAALRERTTRFLKELPWLQVPDQSRTERQHTAICVIGHKGFLREMERGPLGHPDAAEFSNCEIRIYEVMWNGAGELQTPSTCLYSDASLCTLVMRNFPASWTMQVPDLPGKVGALLSKFGHLRQEPVVKETEEGLEAVAVFEEQDDAAVAAKRLDGLDMRNEEERIARPTPYLADQFSARVLYDVEQERWQQ